MIRTTRLTAAAVAAVALGVLVGCAPGTDPTVEPTTDPTTVEETAAETPCVVGEWQLDVPDYSAQSEAYVLGLGLPITEFAMTGAGVIEFTDDGLVATDIDLTITGTIVAGDTRVPLNTRSSYTASGDWSGGEDGTLDFANWSTVPDPSVPVDPEAPDIPAIDYTGIPSVIADCSADTLVLQAPDAPFSARWQR